MDNNGNYENQNLNTINLPLTNTTGLNTQKIIYLNFENKSLNNTTQIMKEERVNSK